MLYSMSVIFVIFYLKKCVNTWLYVMLHTVINAATILHLMLSLALEFVPGVFSFFFGLQSLSLSLVGYLSFALSNVLYLDFVTIFNNYLI